MEIKYFILGILTLIFGIFLTIGLYKEANQLFKKEELQVIFYSIMFNISISFACAGLDLMFFE